MDLLLMIFFSVKISRLAKEKKESRFGWVFRYLSLCLGFELFLMYVLSFFVQQSDIVKKMNNNEVITSKDLLPLLFFGFISCFVIYLVFTFLKKALLSINNDIIDSGDDDTSPPTPPKDLSYFR